MTCKGSGYTILTQAYILAILVLELWVFLSSR